MHWQKKNNVYWSLRAAARQSARLAERWTGSTAFLTSNARLFFLFGTGKTELAKQTAKYIHKDVKKVTPLRLVLCRWERSVVGRAGSPGGVALCPPRVAARLIATRCEIRTWTLSKGLRGVKRKRLQPVPLSALLMISGIINVKINLTKPCVPSLRLRRVLTPCVVNTFFAFVPDNTVNR